MSETGKDATVPGPDGGPAFPSAPRRETIERGYIDRPAVPGMSLRDWFAGQALAGMCAHADWGTTPGDDPTTLAGQAYVQAEAMLFARERTDS